MKKTTSGFTIVELLIVIVVIAILAAISIVAYSGIQDRSRFAKSFNDIQSINKAIKLYQVQNGTYPVQASWQYYCTSPSSFISALSDVVQSIPAAPCTGAGNSDDSWIYRSDGVDYKLLYIRANVSAGYRNLVPSDMRDTGGTNRWGAGTTWGYWTAGYANT